MSYQGGCESCHGGHDEGYTYEYDDEEYQYSSDFYADQYGGHYSHGCKKPKKQCPPPPCPQVPCSSERHACLLSDVVVPPPSSTSDCKCPNGHLNATLDKCCKQICICFRVHDLSSDVTSAAIHDGAIGSNGPVVKTLDVRQYCKDVGYKGHGCNKCAEKHCFYGNAKGFTWTKHDDEEPLTQELVEKFVNGDLYVQFNTADNPNGEVRGQILAFGFLSHRRNGY